MKYLLDSDVIIEILRENTKVAAQLRELYLRGNIFCYSPVTKAEIYHGIRSGEENKTANFFAQLECILIDAKIGEKAGTYLKSYRKSHGVQLGDALIAASSFYSKAYLITFNEKHYPMKDITLHSFS
ncbi:type II toxin-antitoxin system VapC family toxin [bacterium]|nr:type II toxin-antitoxin system VapC family toxin [bacterium]MBU1753830.1 type II toxin-antitoxin system VapC family toxin [bacterium]